MRFSWRSLLSQKSILSTGFRPLANWLVRSFLTTSVGVLILSSPAEAGKLQSWHYDSAQNRLEFRTDSGVQPRAQLVANPTRLVIDLPNTTLGRPLVNQPLGGAIRSLRVGQFNRETTRIVVELAPGYTLNPNQVRFRGITASHWTVQLPPPQRVPSPPRSSSPFPSSNSDGNAVVQAVPVAAPTQVQGVRVTPDGFFIRTSGGEPTVEVDRSRDRKTITVDLKNAALSPELTQRDQIIGRFGVNRLLLSQEQNSPPIAQLTLKVEETSSDWRATVSPFGGVVLVPSQGTALVRASGNQNQRFPGQTSSSSGPQAAAIAREPATIQAIELTGDGSQLLIRADQPLSGFSQGWDRQSAAYRVVVDGARFSDEVQEPELRAGGPILRIRLRQEDKQTAAILIDPGAGVRIGELNQPNTQSLALLLQRPGSLVAEPPPRPITVPPPVAQSPSNTLPRPPRGRVVVIVDPGHGGPDVGAVGIGGLQEKNIVLPLSLEVARLLEQQGVQAVLTRRDDRDLDLEPRVQLAERTNADLFVSIHANAISLSRPEINGVETYYYSSGLQLAQTIHNTILGSLQVRDRGVRRARFYVLRRTSMPAVLLEVGFVTGSEDAPRLATSAYRSKMAAAIARGILQYIKRTF